MLMAAPPAKAQTLADILERLGDVAPQRVRLQPYPATAEDVVRIEQSENRLFELVDGFLVEKTMGYQEAWIATALIYALQNYVLPRNLGAVTGPDGMIRFPGNLLRIPDVAFASWDRFPGGEIPDEAAPEITPDLAVEVLSPGNTQGEMSRKLREYFKAGVRLVWFVDPKAQTVTVYTSSTRSRVVTAGGFLDGGKVLPGFKLPVTQIFAKPKRKLKKQNGG
jgi:Uma2 family endonuclease